MPLRFEANRGQWNAAVRYGAHGSGYELLLTGQGATLQFAGAGAVDVTFAHSNRAPEIEPLDRMAALTDYFLGPRENWHAGVANYARVRYREVYPGIDLVYYGNQRQLEYDFVLQPGADPRAIRMNFHGAQGVSITPEGDLAIEAASGRLVQKRPLVYQEDSSGRRTPIAGRYVLLAHRAVGVRVDGYDRKRRLVIDPVLSYSTYIGGSGLDQVTAVQLDPNGRLYVAGSTGTGDLSATDGAYNNANAGNTDIFFAIFDTSSTGNDQLVYLTYLGGTNNDTALALAVDPQGRAYITGTTNSTDFPMAGNSVQTVGPASVTDAFVAVLDPSQAGGAGLIYSTFLGGTTGKNSGNAIALDQNGNIFVVGTTASTDFPVTSSAYAGVLWGTSDAFITELNMNSTSLVYSTYIGGELDDDGRGVAVLPNGQVYFAVSTDSLQFPLAGPSYNPNNAGGYDIVVGLLDTTKSATDSLIYSTYFGGSANDMVRGAAVDIHGNLLLTGYTLSSDFPVTTNAAQYNYGGGGDAFVAVVNATHGFVQYSSFLGGSDGEVGYAVAGDSAGMIYIAGYTLSADFPVTSNAPQPNWGHGIDVFVTSINPAVSGPPAAQYATYFGGATINSAAALAVDANSTVYVGGYTEGEFPIGGNAYQGGFAGGTTDGFILVLANGAASQTTLHRPTVTDGGAVSESRRAHLHQ
jgi:hypothetical protein